MMKKVLRILTAVTFLLTSFTGTLWAQRIDIDVVGGKALFPIAIAPFKSPDNKQDSSRAPQDLRNTISQDLTFTGLFKILDSASYLEDLSAESISSNKIDFQSWSVIGAQGLVTGIFRAQGKQVILEVRLFDVTQGQFLVGRRYVGDQETIRRIAHKASNLIYSALTGEEGIFETKIAFVKNESVQKELYLMDYDGYNAKRFSFHGSISLSPEWSPNGGAITFTSYKNGRGCLYLKEYASRQEKLISQYPDLNVTAAWAPDAKEIALTLSKDGNPEIYLIGLDGKVTRRLTNNWGIDVSPVWSPDGQKIAFVSDRSGSPQVFTMNRDGSQIQRITYNGNYNSDPDWSPRGDKIVYSSRRGGGFQVCTMNPDGSQDIQLTWEGNNECPKWSPNGRHITFMSSRAGGKQIYSMLADGTIVRQLTTSGTNNSPDWSPQLPY